MSDGEEMLSLVSGLAVFAAFCIAALLFHSGDETALERRDYLCRFGGALPRASRNVPPNGADDREPFQRGLAGVCCGVD